MPQGSLPPCGGGTERGVAANSEFADGPGPTATSRLAATPLPPPSPARGEGAPRASGKSRGLLLLLLHLAHRGLGRHAAPPPREGLGTVLLPLAVHRPVRKRVPVVGPVAERIAVP